MAKKTPRVKPAPRRTKARPAARQKTARAKPARKSATGPPAKPGKRAKAVVRRRKPSAAPRPAAEKSLGRPLVTAEEKLYLLFHEDFHARQIFEFLKVETVGELEQYSPQEIIRILSAPVRNTVERIRQRLAEQKRSLRDDRTFARDYLSAKR